MRKTQNSRTLPLHQEGIVRSWLTANYRGEIQELFYSEDHFDGPRWVARYPSGMSWNTWGACMTANFRECVVERDGTVREVSGEVTKSAKARSVGRASNSETASDKPTSSSAPSVVAEVERGQTLEERGAV